MKHIEKNLTIMRILVLVTLCLSVTVGTVLGQDPPTAKVYNWDQNYGTVKLLYPEPNKTYFTLTGGVTAMKPSAGYYFVPRAHANYDAMIRLLYLAAQNRWTLKTRTQPTLDANGHAEVIYFVVEF